MNLLDYVCEKYNISIHNEQERVNRINSIMSKLKVGDKLYDNNCWGDVFEQEVIEIIDKDNGKIKTFEKGINSTKIQNVDSLNTKEEIEKFHRIKIK